MALMKAAVKTSISVTKRDGTASVMRLFQICAPVDEPFWKFQWMRKKGRNARNQSGHSSVKGDTSVRGGCVPPDGCLPALNKED